MIDEQNRKALIKALLESIDPEPEREGLVDTPKRVDKAYKEIFGGYDINPEDALNTTFIEGACDEMVILKNIRGFSTCEHHVLPFSYVAHIGYIPDKKVVGLSKMARLVDLFARRLQIQEKMTTEIADAFIKHLKPKGCMVVISGKHLCMQARGVKQHDSTMVTSAIRGVFKEKKEVRDEFLALIANT